MPTDLLHPWAALAPPQADDSEGFAGSASVIVEDIDSQEFRVISMHGVEALSEGYRFEVFFSAPEHHAGVLAACAGKRATLWLTSADAEPRAMTGVVSATRVVSTHRQRIGCLIEVRPRLWQLSKTKRRRVYQQQTAVQIVSSVFAEHRVPARLSLARSYARRSYCLQYDESDRAFVERLCAEEGIFYFFELLAPTAAAEQPAERIVLGDTPSAYSAMPNTLSLLPAGAGALDVRSRVVTHFQHGSSIQPDIATLRTYDYRQAAIAPLVDLHAPEPDAAAPPGTTTESTAPARQASADGSLEIYEHHGDDEDAQALATSAARRLEQLRRDAQFAQAQSPHRHFEAGHTFKLDDAEGDASGHYAVTRVEHRYGVIEGSTDTYRARISCVPAKVSYRPDRPPRRTIQVVETGVVVGAAEREIETELAGCVKVQFHWDRRGRLDESSSCWIRVAQAWAGPSYGFQFIPRVGMEVLVAFVGGDPDRPIVIGCLPNPANIPPARLPEDRTQSIIRTQTVPATGGGYNEIRFEDAAERQVFGIRAERNLERYVGNDERVTIGNHVDVEIGGGRTARIKGSDKKRISGNHELLVAGSIHQRVGGAQSIAINGDRTLKVTGVDNETVGSGRVATYKHFCMTTVGEADEGVSSIQVSGSHHVSATTEVRLLAGKSLSISCGDSTISMTPEGIRIEANQIALAAKETLSLEGGASSGVLGAALSLKAPVIVNDGGGAIVTLAGGPTVSSPWVIGGGAAEVPAPDNSAETSGVAMFQILPPPGLTGPFTLKISQPDGSVVERVTDAGHRVTLVGRPGEQFVLQEVRFAGVRLPHEQQVSIVDSD